MTEHSEKFIAGLLSLWVSQGQVSYWDRPSPGHYRVNGVLDLWPASQEWRSLLTGKRGRYSDVVTFVMGYFHPEMRQRN